MSSRHGGLVQSSYVTVWSRTLRSEGVTPKDAEADAAETRARAAFGACVAAINAVDSLSYRFAKASQAHGWMGAVIANTRANRPGSLAFFLCGRACPASSCSRRRQGVTCTSSQLQLCAA